MFQHFDLLADVERLSQGLPEGQIQVYRSRGSDFLCIGPDDRYPQSWNALAFNFFLNQSYGLVAHASSGR